MAKVLEKAQVVVVGSKTPDVIRDCKMTPTDTIDEALQVTNKDVMEILGGLPPIKVHCSLLAEEAIKAAVDDYRSKAQGS